MDSSLIYLAQTDTTVGFLSSRSDRLSEAKQRDPNQKILQVVDSLKTLQNIQRVPNRFKKKVRNSHKTTFIYPSKKAFRVVNDTNHRDFLKKFHLLYSTSANITKQNFCLETAVEKSDVVVFSKYGFIEKSASSIFLLGTKKIKKIR